MNPLSLLIWLFLARRDTPAPTAPAQPFTRRNAAGTVTETRGGYLFDSSDGRVRFRFRVNENAPSMKPILGVEITRLERGSQAQAAAVRASRAFAALVSDLLPAMA